MRDERLGPDDDAGEPEAIVLLRALVEDTACSFDHHGSCQEHSWLGDAPCPNGAARAFLARLDSR